MLRSCCPILEQQIGRETARWRGEWLRGEWGLVLQTAVTEWPHPEGKLTKGSQQISEETAWFGWMGLNLWEQNSTLCAEPLEASVLMGQRQHGLRGFLLPPCNVSGDRLNHGAFMSL